MMVVMVYRVLKSKRETQPLISNRDQKVRVLQQLLPLLAYPIIYFLLVLFPLINRTVMAISNSKDRDLMKAHAITGAVMGSFAAFALLLHICVMKCTKYGKKLSREEDHLSTFTGITPYTSGAVTDFTVPNESDVERTGMQ